MNYKSNSQDEHKYDDIIVLPHHVSKSHPQMSLLNRAAQFSPFAALTGYEDAICETARVTEAFIELDQDKREQMDRQLQLIRKNLSRHPLIEVIYFQPDSLKDGGTYMTFQGQVKRINDCQRQLLFTDGTALPLENLFCVRGELFQNTGI